MFSTFAAYGFFFICLAAVSAMLAVMLAGVYWRRGPVTGLLTLGAVSLAGTWVLSGDFTIPIVVLCAVLIHGAEREWSISAVIWRAFGFNTLVITAWMVMVYFALQARPAAAAEIESLLAELQVSRWMIASAPGFLIGAQFIAAWLALVLAAGSHSDLWTRESLQEWELPWGLIWALIGCGFGLLGSLQGWIRFSEDSLVPTVFASGVVVGASLFLVQGLLVGLVAMRTWKLPVWLGVLSVLALWHFLPLVGIAEIWGDFRGRMRAYAARREEERGPGGGDF